MQPAIDPAGIEQMQESLAQLQEVHDQITEVRESLTEVTVTRTSPDRSVSVTIGSMGEVRRVEFPNSAYRFMSAADLGRTIAETVNKARTEATEQVMETMAPFLSRQSVLSDGHLGGLSLQQILNPWADPDGADADTREAPMSVEVPDRLAVDPQDELAVLFERSGTSMATLDERGLVLAIDPDLARRAGPFPQQPRGRPFAAVLHHSSRLPFQRAWTQLAQGSAAQLAQRLTVGVATPFPARVTTVAARHADGRLASAVVIVEREGDRDVPSERIQLTSVAARVLEGVAAGASTAELATRLYLSRQGVEYHVATMLRTFGAANRSALVARAYVLGVLIQGAWPPRVAETSVSIPAGRRRR